MSLLELLIALAIAGIIAAGLYGFFGATHQTYSDQAATARMLQNAATAMTMITKDIRMAGTFREGGPTSLTPCRLIQALVSADNAAGGTITIRIVLDDAPRRTELAPPSQSQNSGTLRVLSTAGFNVNDTAFITDGVECTRFRVTALAGGNPPGLEHTPGNDVNSPGGNNYVYPAASSLVYRRDPNSSRVITYAIEAAGTARWLTRDMNTGAGPVRVVPDIESLRFFYRNNAGATINDPSTINTAALAATIRFVNVTVTSRAERPSRVVGGDGFRRHTLTSSIQLRNLGQ